ncbi:MAG: YrhA family protein [Lentimicrobium sp.]
MSKTITSLLRKYSALVNAEIYKSCNEEILEESSGLMIESGHAWSPELNEFYKVSNGFFYNGIYIFSVRSEEREEHYDLLVQNVQWEISDRLPGCVLFGRSDEEVYVYNEPEKKYQILDFTGWDEYYSFDSLAELFEFVVSERI